MPTDALRGVSLMPQAPGEHLHHLYKQGGCKFLLLEGQQLPFLTCVLPAAAARGRWQPQSSPRAELAQGAQMPPEVIFCHCV